MGGETSGEGLVSRPARERLSLDGMYDFCLTYPYAALLALGGFMGYMTKGSVPSLAGGLGTAAILAACAQLSLNSYHQGQLNKTATSVSLLVTLGLTAMMGARWHRTGKFMPAGLVVLLSAAMVVFYMWNLVHYKEPLHHKSSRQ